MQIYMTVNRLSGKFYIGKDTKSNNRYLGSGLYIKRALNKYGWWNFYKIIIEEVETAEELQEREIYWIAYYRRLREHLMYNITPGGEWGDTFTNHPDKEKIRKKISNSQKIRFSNDDAREKLREAHKGKKLSIETRKKISKAGIGKKLSIETRKKISKANKNQIRSAETRKKLSEANKGKILSESTRNKMSEAFKAKWPNAEFRDNMFRVRQSIFVNDVRFRYQSRAAITLGISKEELTHRLNSEDYPEYQYSKNYTPTTA